MPNQHLIQQRRKLSLTHDEVAAMANISRAYYTNIEAGRKTPSLKVAKRVADALETDVNRIFFESVVPIRNENDHVSVTEHAVV